MNTQKNTMAPFQLIEGGRVAVKKPLLNQYDRESIATQCLTEYRSRWNVARQFGAHIRDVNAICDEAMFQRGYRAGYNAAKFAPRDSPRTQGRAA